MELKVLSEKEIRKLHDASVRVLKETGVHVPHEKMLELLGAAGADVNKNTQIAKIPEKLIQESLKKAGKKYTIYGRDKEKKAEFGAGKRNYNSIAGEASWIDDGSKVSRYAKLEDVRTAAILSDGLPNINIVGSMADPHELPVEWRCVSVVAEQLKNTTKPLTFWFHDRPSAKYILELFTAVRGSEKEAIKYPIAYPFLEPISPLKFPFEGIDLLFETCRHDLPVPIGPMAQVGATAPGTLFGTLIQENAEILAGVCIVQLINPGNAVCYGGIPHAFDMRTSQMIFSGPEQGLMAAAMTQMGKSYGLPVYTNVGLTDSKVVDAQAGLESGVSLAMGALAGADIFGHLGICGVDLGTSLMMLTMQNEVIGYIERIMRGINTSDDAMGLDVIKKVGHGGTFIAEEHTVEHFREELWFPKLLDRDYWETWLAKGSNTMEMRCKEQKDDILKNHIPAEMDRNTLKEVDKVVESAKKHLGN